MKITLFFLAALFCGACLNFVASLILSRLVKRKAALPERVRISSIEDADSVLRWRKTQFTPEERSRLWADAMNILMTADSEEVAERYVEKTALALGDEGPEFTKRAEEILEKRFHSEHEPQLVS